MTDDFTSLLAQVRACTICAGLPLGPKPIFQIAGAARILVAAQAPGRIAHERGRSFDDPSGNRLREWMGISRDTFYDENLIALIPMGFCFPGSGKGGDMPPRPECAVAWRKRLLAELPNLRLTLVIGQYAQSWHLPGHTDKPLTERVRHWREFGTGLIPLPHPSPRNGSWLRKNPWFAEEVIPAIRQRVADALELR